MKKSGQDFTAGDIMTSRLVTLEPEMDVFKAIDLLLKHKISGAPVIDKSRRLVGMFTEKSCLEVMVTAAYDGLPAHEVLGTRMLGEMVCARCVGRGVRCIGYQTSKGKGIGLGIGDWAHYRSDSVFGEVGLVHA